MFFVANRKSEKSSVDISSLLISPNFQSEFMDTRYLRLLCTVKDTFSTEFAQIWTAATLTGPNEFTNEFGEVIKSKE